MVVVLDCNIWITLSLNSQLRYISSLSEKEVAIASCSQLRDELADVLFRPKFRKIFSESQIIEILKLHDFATTYHKTGKITKIVSDPKDDYLLALALKSKARYLVTGDKLVLEVGRYKNTEIITLARFKELFNL